jgi:uncharacterized protein YukE
MGDTVVMNYEDMEAMAKAFREAHQQLERTLREIEKQAKLMEEGALQGEAGAELVDGLRGPLTKRLQALSRKMDELDGDLRSAVAFTRDGVQSAQNRFT